MGQGNHKLADVVRQLGGLVRSRAAECRFNRAREIKKSRPTTAKHQGGTKEAPSITLLGSMPPSNAL